MKKRDGTGDFTEYSLEKDEPENICRLGRGPECCIYLAVDKYGWYCARNSAIGEQLTRNLKSGKTSAKGKGCWEGCPWEWEIRKSDDGTVEDSVGVQMIIDLQSLAGVVESPIVALHNWKRFSKTEKLSTIMAHNAMFRNKE